MPVAQPFSVRQAALLPLAALLACLSDDASLEDSRCGSSLRVQAELPDEPMWSWSSNSTHPGLEQVITTPALIHVDGDGVHDLVFTAFVGRHHLAAGGLVAISGATGEQLWSRRDLDGFEPDAAGQVVTVGAQTLVVPGHDDAVLGVSADGRLRFAAAVPLDKLGTSPTLLSLEGEPRVVLGHSVLTVDGEVERVGPAALTRWRTSAFDVDGDGHEELIVGATMLDRATQSVVKFGRAEGHGVIARLHVGGEPRLLHVHEGWARVWSLGGDPVWAAELSGGGGPPLLFDAEPDGQLEIAIASDHDMRVYEASGELRWAQPTRDASSGMTGAVWADLDGDGRGELVYADEHDVWVFDAREGTVLSRLTDHASGTLFEVPRVANLDGDAAAELIVVANDYVIEGRRGVTRYDAPWLGCL